MTRVVAILSAAVAVVLIVAVVWITGEDGGGVSKTDTADYRITRVAFVRDDQRPLAVVEERRASGHTLTVVDLADGEPLGIRNYDGEVDQRRGARRFIGVGHGVLWAVSHDLGLHGRDPSTAAVTITREELAAVNPSLAPALTGEQKRSFRFDLDDRALVIETDGVWHRIASETLRAEAVALADLRLRTEGPQGYRAHRSYVDLPAGGRVVFVRKVGRVGAQIFDSVPTLIAKDGRRMRMNEQLKLTDAFFLYDSASDLPITPGLPASVVLVQRRGLALSRLALTGSETWWTNTTALIPDEPELAGVARLGGAHLSGDEIILHLGPRLVAVSVETGDRIWSYPAP